MKKIIIAIITISLISFVSCKKQDKQIEVPKVEETQQVKEELPIKEKKPVEEVKPVINECYSETELNFAVNWGYGEDDCFGATKYQIPSQSLYLNSKEKIKSINFDEDLIYTYENGLLISVYRKEPKRPYVDPMTYYSYDEHHRLQKKYNLNSDGEMYNVEEFVYYVDSDNNLLRFSLFNNIADSVYREIKTSDGYLCEYYIGDSKNDLRKFTPQRMKDELNNTIEVFLKNDLIVKTVDRSATNNSYTTTTIEYKKNQAEHIKLEEYYNDKLLRDYEAWYTFKKGKRVSSNSIQHYYSQNQEYTSKSTYTDFDEYDNWIKVLELEPKQEESEREITYYE